MKNFLQKLQYNFSRMMYGRYGVDEFSRFLSWGTTICWILNIFTNIEILFYFGLIMIIYDFFRMFSKNYAKRQTERQIYLFYKGKFDAKTALYRRMWNERKTHVFIKCPSCKTVLRLPKGRGKIEITCPKCKKDFIKKT